MVQTVIQPETSFLVSTVVPGLCHLSPALGISVAAKPPETCACLLWSLHPFPIHHVCYFWHQREAFLCFVSSKGPLNESTWEGVEASGDASCNHGA